MKTFIVTIVMGMLSMMMTGGCLEMMTPAEVETATGQVKKLTESVDAYQRIVSDAVDRMEKDKVIDEDTAGRIRQLGVKMDRIQPVMEDAVTSVIEAEYSGDKLVDAVIVAQAVNAASAPVNPYAPAIDMAVNGILALIATGSVGMAIKKNSDAKTETKKYQAHKVGTELYKLNHPDAAAELYANIGDARKNV